MEKSLMTRDKIIALLSEDGKQSTASLAKEIDITIKVVEKQLSLIKVWWNYWAKRPCKGGEWVGRLIKWTGDKL